MLLPVVTAFFSIFSAVLMTEPGQSLNLPQQLGPLRTMTTASTFIGLNLALLGLPLVLAYQKLDCGLTVKCAGQPKGYWSVLLRLTSC